MLRLLLGFVLCMFSLLALTPVYAITPPHSDFEKMVEDIGMLINYQDFSEAKKTTQSLLEKYDISRIAWELSYTDFLTILYIVTNDAKSYTLKDDLISQRIEFYPDEVDDCAFVTYVFGYSTPCEVPSASSEYSDRLEYTIRLITARKQQSAALNIRMLERSASTLQEYRDLGNLMQWYLSAYPQYEKIIAHKMDQIGKKIIDHDPYWMDGYTLQTWSILDSPDDLAAICVLMRENYRGDEYHSQIRFSMCQ